MTIAGRLKKTDRITAVSFCGSKYIVNDIEHGIEDYILHTNSTKEGSIIHKSMIKYHNDSEGNSCAYFGNYFYLNEVIRTNTPWLNEIKVA